MEFSSSSSSSPGISFEEEDNHSLDSASPFCRQRKGALPQQHMGVTKVNFKPAHSLRRQDVHDKQPNQTTQVDIRKLQPEWLESFCSMTFFLPCPEHPIRRNELNKYCIDCDTLLCQYCLSLDCHTGHRILKIYRHVYKEVVPFDEIEQHMDCSQIQPYRCNKQLVIALTPLPHSGGKSSDETTCLTCGRKLIEYDLYTYCSIACKVEAFKRKSHDSAPPFLLLDHLVHTGNQDPELEKMSPDDHLEKQESELQSAVDQPEKAKEEAGPSLRKRKRKGIPHRAPFF